MSDKTSMSFTLNQAALNAAIAAELPRLLQELDFDYVSGRQPKGLTAQVTVNESMIRQSVLAYARRNVGAQYTHFDIAFKATRGEDGITTTVTASTSTVQAEVEEVEAETPACPMPASVEVTVEDSFEDEGDSAFNEEEPIADDVSAEADSTEVADAPAPAARSRLFAGLKRPDNSAPAE